MICPKCKKSLPDGSKFCGYCGSRISAKKCPKCNNEIPEGTEYCIHCGAHINSISEKSGFNSVNKKSSYILFAWVLSFVALCFISGIGTFIFQHHYLYDVIGVRILQFVLWLLPNFTFLLIPFAISKKSLKIVSIILVSFYVVCHVAWMVYRDIHWLMYWY